MPTTDTKTDERESRWPFVVEARVIAVPARAARVIVVLLAVAVALLGVLVWLVASTPIYRIVR